MSGAIPPVPHTPSWRGAQLKHRDNFTGSEVDPSSYPVGTGAFSLEVKRPDHEADHSFPSSAEKNAWSFTDAFPVRLHGV
jgi:hypothetical protein